MPPKQKPKRTHRGSSQGPVHQWKPRPQPTTRKHPYWVMDGRAIEGDIEAAIVYVTSYDLAEAKKAADEEFGDDTCVFDPNTDKVIYIGKRMNLDI